MSVVYSDLAAFYKCPMSAQGSVRERILRLYLGESIVDYACYDV